MGHKADGAAKSLIRWWRVAQAAPVDTLEARCHLLRDLRGKSRFANTAHTQQRHQPTVFVDGRCRQHRQFFRATDESRRVWSLAPILASLSWLRAEYRCGCDALVEYLGEPRAVERRVHA